MSTRASRAITVWTASAISAATVTAAGVAVYLADHQSTGAASSSTTSEATTGTGGTVTGEESDSESESSEKFSDDSAGSNDWGTAPSVQSGSVSSSAQGTTRAS